MTVKVAPKKKPRKAPTVEQTATAPKATSRAPREVSVAPEQEEKRGRGRPRKSDGSGKPLNFNVDPEFAIEYKSFALSQGLTMRELLENSFQEYKRNHG